MGEVDKQPENIIRVVLADDSSIFLNTLKQFLGQHHEFVIVGEAHNGTEALALALQLRPDLILLDLQMSELSGPKVIASLRSEVAETRIVILSLFDWQEFALRLGVHAYVSKAQFVDKLLPTIQEVMRGNSAMTDAHNSEDNSR